MKQIIHWVDTFNTINGTTFQTLFAGRGPVTGGTLEPTVGAPWSVAGTFSKLKVVRATAPGSGKAVTYTLYKNGSATGLTVTITDPATSASDTTHTVSVSAGDTVALQRTNTGGGPASSQGAVALEFDATDDHQSGYCYAPNLYPTATTAVYQGLAFSAPLSGSLSWIGTDDYTTDELIPIDGALTRFDIQIRASGLTGSGFADFQSGDSVTFVLLKNGIVQDGSSGTVNTTMTLTHPTASATWTGTLALAAGDTVKIRATPNSSMVTHGSSGSLAYAILMGWCFDSTTTHRFWLGSANGNAGSTAATQYGAAARNGFGNSTTESTRQGYGSVTTWYAIALESTGETGTSYWAIVGRLNAATSTDLPSIVVGRTLQFGTGPNSTNFEVVVVGTAVSPGGTAFMTITGSDVWTLQYAVADPIIGSAVFGTKTTVKATRAVAFGLNDATNVHDTAGMLKVFGDVAITGDLTVDGTTTGSGSLSDDLDALGT